MTRKFSRTRRRGRIVPRSRRDNSMREREDRRRESFGLLDRKIYATAIVINVENEVAA